MVRRRQVAAAGGGVCRLQALPPVAPELVHRPRSSRRLVGIEVRLGVQGRPDHGELEAEPCEIRLELERLAFDLRPVLSLQALLLDLRALLGLLA